MVEREKLIDFLVRYGGRCRDCADEAGFCPSTGIGCGQRQRAAEHFVGALEYGIENGFVATSETKRIATLEAQLAERVKVKPLEWSPVEEWKECSRERAPAFGGEYQIVMLDPGEGELPSLYFEIGLGSFMFRFEQDQDPMGLLGETCPKKFPSVADAKVAAQADYESRILSALEATPPAPKVTDAMAEAASREYMRIFGKHLLSKHARLILTAAQEAGKP